MKRRILSIDITNEPYGRFISIIQDIALSKRSSYICVANVHMCIEAYNDLRFAEVVNQAEVVTPDGMPLVLALKMLHGINQDRVAGMDLLPDLLEISVKKEISIYFYGGTPEMLEATHLYCTQNYPGIKIAGLHSPPFRNQTDEEEVEVIKAINKSGAGLVFVALGCPKQERWMASMKGRINACMIGIGGALPVMIGMQKRAPSWMQKASLEWLYRLLQEPRRLFKRYAVTNSTFIYLLFRKWAKQGFRPINL